MVRNDRLLRLILGWTALTLLLTWLPLVRGLMDGASYMWGKSYFGWVIGGAGVGGDYWVLLIEVAIGLTILWRGWRGGRWPFHGVLLSWHALMATSAVYAAWTDPEQYRFRGDTLGVDVSLAWVGPMLCGGFFLLSLLWVVRDLRSTDRCPIPAWGRTNTKWLTRLLGIVPVQFVLLHYFDDVPLTDQLGVVLTIAQCLLLGRIFRPSHATASSEPLPWPAPS